MVDALSTWKLEDLTDDQIRVLLYVAVVLGVLYCFWGYRMFKLVLAVTGFALAGGMAAALAAWLAFGNLLIVALALLVGGLCGAFALLFVYRAGVFLVGFLTFFLAAFVLLERFPFAWAPWLAILIALGGGVLALLIERPVMMLATAGLGGWMTTHAVALLLGAAPFPPPDGLWFLSREIWWVLLGWGLLTGLGAATQVSAYRHKRRKEAEAA